MNQTLPFESTVLNGPYAPQLSRIAAAVSLAGHNMWAGLSLRLRIGLKKRTMGEPSLTTSWDVRYKEANAARLPPKCRVRFLCSLWIEVLVRTICGCVIFSSSNSKQSGFSSTAVLCVPRTWSPSTRRAIGVESSFRT